MVALSCRTFILGHVLIDYAFGATIPITHGDPDGGGDDDCDIVRSAAKSGGYCAVKTIPLINTLELRVLQQPLMSATPVR